MPTQSAIGILPRPMRGPRGQMRPIRGVSAVLASLAMLAALALALGGCGSDQKGTYKDEYRKAADEFKQSTDLAAKQVPKRLRDRTPALRSFKQSLDELAGRLAGLDPP